ncbi:MAG: hypothetical protein L3J97_00795 [Thermoplasmata archaeon]|nr:hypothetical protein [Thermoplasmata archaeon]
MRLKILTGGRWRRWLGERLGGDFELGDRAWRRILHFFGAAVLLYYMLPSNVVGGFTREELLLTALGLVLVLELLRWAGGVELPTIRTYERARIASYVFYAIALVAAVLLFPLPIALVVVLGTAFVDPLIGELRLSPRMRSTYPWFPGVVYVLLGSGALILGTHWPPFPAVIFAGVAGVVALAVERPKIRDLDDDLAMTLVPALVLAAMTLLAPGVFP